MKNCRPHLYSTPLHIHHQRVPSICTSTSYCNYSLLISEIELRNEERFTGYMFTKRLIKYELDVKVTFFVRTSQCWYQAPSGQPKNSNVSNNWLLLTQIQERTINQVFHCLLKPITEQRGTRKTNELWKYQLMIKFDSRIRFTRFVIYFIS